MWCGINDESILVLSEKGSVYRSRDRGNSWKKLQNIMGKVGSGILDPGQQVILENANILLDWDCILYNAEPR